MYFKDKYKHPQFQIQLMNLSSYFPLTKKDQDLSLRYRKQKGRLHAVLRDENESFNALCHYSSLYDLKELFR